MERSVSCFLSAARLSTLCTGRNNPENRKKKILGEVKQYYILKLPCNDMNVMIPVDSEQSVGIREIVDESAVRSAIEILREDSTAMDRNWNRRYRENMQKLKTGDILVVAEVVRNLIRAGRQKAFRPGRQRCSTTRNRSWSAK